MVDDPWLSAPDHAPRRPAGHAPVRQPSSVRRTSSIDMTWPDGRDGLITFSGYARDLRTGEHLAATNLVAEDRLHARLGWDRVIRDAKATPARARIGELVGARGGGHLRALLGEVMHTERDAGSPLYLLLDDLSGASLIAGWAWSRWRSDWMQRAPSPRDGRSVPGIRNMENICAGFRTGSSALRSDGAASPAQSTCAVVPLAHPEDPIGWHPLPEHPGVSMRRARRIDVWRDAEGRAHVDAGFQDSATVPEGGRVAIHEYRLHAVTDAGAHRLAHIEAIPHVLPYKECPAAAANVQRLTGSTIAQLRTRVIEMLPGTLGCTHLNDALRALADVHTLLASLPART